MTPWRAAGARGEVGCECIFNAASAAWLALFMDCDLAGACGAGGYLACSSEYLAKPWYRFVFWNVSDENGTQRYLSIKSRECPLEGIEVRSSLDEGKKTKEYRKSTRRRTNPEVGKHTFLEKKPTIAKENEVNLHKKEQWGMSEESITLGRGGDCRKAWNE